MSIRLGDIALDFEPGSTAGPITLHRALAAPPRADRARVQKGFIGVRPHLRLTPQPNK